MQSINVYPSTSDCPLIAGGQDACLAILVGGHDRYKANGVSGTYIDRDGSVCAIGSLLVGAGVDPTSYERSCPCDGSDIQGILEFYDFEKSVIKGAKKAIKYLDKAVLELYPRVPADGGEAWSGPAEYLNEYGINEGFFNTDLARKRGILKCYRLAIKNRKEKLAKKARKR